MLEMGGAISSYLHQADLSEGGLSVAWPSGLYYVTPFPSPASPDPAGRGRDGAEGGELYTASHSTMGTLIRR